MKNIKNVKKNTEFEDLKEEFNQKVKPHNPCIYEYKRFLSTKNQEELLKVIYDNINWCASNSVLSHEYFSKFNKETYLTSGIANTGKENNGWANSGNSNSGDSNSGDSNSGNRNSGAFCTENNPKIFLFDKETNMTVKEWEDSKAIKIMNSIDPTIWIPFNSMTDEEKNNNPKAETTEGYLKTISIKEAWKNAWHNFTDEYKKVFIDLPNFCPIKFEEITGIKVK